MKSTEIISFIAAVTSDSLFGIRKCTSLGDKKQLLLSILSSGLCQDEVRVPAHLFVCNNDKYLVASQKTQLSYRVQLVFILFIILIFLRQFLL